MAPRPHAELVQWIAERIQEPSASWKKKSRAAQLLPTPINLPGMDKAAAAVLAKYACMSTEWCADVIQDFMVRWLLRPETSETIARSALAGIERGVVRTVEDGIAWKLRMEILSRAHRALRKERREAECRALVCGGAEAYEWDEHEQAAAC